MARACKPGQLRVRRKAYTRRDGTRVRATQFCAEDRGAPGRGPKVIPPLKEGALGGPGFLSKPERTRHKLLAASVERDGYRTTLGRLNALEVFGKRTFSQKELDTIEADRQWLVRKFGGPGSFGPRKRRRKSNPGTPPGLGSLVKALKF